MSKEAIEYKEVVLVLLFLFFFFPDKFTPTIGL